MSFIKSEIFSANPVVSGDSIRLAIVKDDTRAYDANGNEFVLTPCALSQDFKSWEDGIVTINHKYKEQGTLKDLEYSDGFVYATLEGLSQEVLDLVNSKAFRGTSQESVPIEVDENKVLRLKGTGTTLVFYPENPECSPKMGCGIIASTEVTVGEEERHEFDIATVNNAGTRVKTRETSVWMFGCFNHIDDLGLCE